jgi:hypothetical protein
LNDYLLLNLEDGIGGVENSEKLLLRLKSSRKLVLEAKEILYGNKEVINDD